MGKGLIPIILLLFLTACLPPPAQYPYKPADVLFSEADSLSDKLNQYIDEWIAGKRPAEIPDSILPVGIDSTKNRHFFLQKFEEIQADSQWIYRSAGELDFKGLKKGFYDPHATYLFLSTALAPFGDELVIEGEYPYCRFFSIQLSPPLDGKTYCAAGTYGPAETSVADIDIPAMQGSENPFAKGGNRMTTNRKYQIKFEMAYGDSIYENPNAIGEKKRYASFIQNQGPWWKELGGKGPWNAGNLCIRYYAPDHNKGAMTGISLPKAYYVHKNGIKYFIQSDYSGLKKDFNSIEKARKSWSKEPSHSMGPQVGWFKSFGLLQSIGAGLLNYHSINFTVYKNYFADIEKGATGRGPGLDGRGSIEASSGFNTFSSYLTRMMKVGRKNVFILKGKLPTFPITRNGRKTLDSASLRYFSISTYDLQIQKNTHHYELTSYALSSVMDDEIILDSARNYTIIYSRKKDRPQNAVAKNGVTWVEWGPKSEALLLLRWLSVEPDWIMNPNPHQKTLSWEKTSFLSENYDENLIGKNYIGGLLGDYLPRFYYMSKRDFESLDLSKAPYSLPDWRIYR